MKELFGIAVHALAVVVLVVAIGGIASLFSMRQTMSAAPDPTLAPPVAPRAHDPSAPLVAILLGDTQSDVTDVLGPYALFAESNAYDVNLVAASRAVRTLTGGLEVVPQLTFAALDALRPSGAEIVIIPAMIDVAAKANAAVLDFVRRMHERGATLFSWCTGAEVLAASGVADGRALTAHWGDIDRLESTYPRVQWRRGVRYVDGDKLVSAAGLTSGIDATLHLLALRNGPEVASRVADALRLPSSRYVASPAMTQHVRRAPDAIYLLNAAFYWPKRTSGVLLFEGVGELELAALFDAYPASWTDSALTVASTPTVVSRHGLTLAPRATTLPAMARLLVPSESAEAHLVPSMRAELRGRGIPIVALGDAGTDPFRPVLESLAREAGLATARFAAKRFEYRSPSLRLVGPAVSPRPFAVLLLVCILSAASVVWVGRRIGRRSHRTEATP